MTPDPEGSPVARAAARALGVAPESVAEEALAGHASARRYVRVHAGRRSVVVMVLPPDAFASEEASGEGRPGELPFLVVQRYLEDLGVRVPAVLLADLDEGVIVLEDLGDVTLEAALLAAPNPEAERIRLYGAAIDTLAFMRTEAARAPEPTGLVASRAFDETLLRWELDHFLEWGLEAGHGATLSPGEAEVVSAAFDDVARRLAALPRGFTHRDYQSRNLMVAGRELALIDFQDALMGPAVYDLVALLRDSYVVLPAETVRAMLLRYTDQVRALGARPVEPEQLEAEFDLQTVQRKLKDAGRFEYISRVKHNDDFLPHIPASLAYVREALSRLPEYARLHEILGAQVEALRP